MLHRAASDRDLNVVIAEWFVAGSILLFEADKSPGLHDMLCAACDRACFAGTVD